MSKEYAPVIPGGLAGLRAAIEEMYLTAKSAHDRAENSFARAKYYNEMSMTLTFLASIDAVNAASEPALEASGDITVEMKRKYLAKHGNVCPYCGSSNINAGEGEFDEVVTQEVSCEDCGAVWSDRYHIVDVDEVEKPTMPLGWNSDYSEHAKREGWNLFSVEGCRMIQRVDEMNRFTSDEEAIEFVKRAAADDDKTAVLALLYHDYYVGKREERDAGNP